MEMTEEYINDQATKAMNGVFGVVAQCGNTKLLGMLLEMVISMSVAILRGLKDEQYVEGFLTAAIKDTDNVIDVEELTVQ